MPPHPSGQGLVGGGCGQHLCSERGWGSRAGVFVGFLAIGVGWLSPAPTWEQPPAPFLFLTVFFFFFFSPHRHGRRAAPRPAGVRCHGGVAPRRLGGHVGLPALHLHEPAGHGALRDVQPAPHLAPPSQPPARSQPPGSSSGARPLFSLPPPCFPHPPGGPGAGQGQGVALLLLPPRFFGAAPSPWGSF